MNQEKKLLSRFNQKERLIKTPENFIYSAEFLQMSPLNQRRAREAVMYGTIADVNLLMDERFMDEYSDNVAVGIHEAGHEDEAESNGFSVRKTQVFRSGALRGITEFSINFWAGVKDTYRKLMRVGFAGGAAVEADGLKAEGCGSDHSKARTIARILGQHFNLSESLALTEAESSARQNAQAKRETLVRRGHMLASAAI